MQSREGEGKDASGLRSVGGGRLREGDGQMKELLPLFFFFEGVSFVIIGFNVYFACSLVAHFFLLLTLLSPWPFGGGGA